MKFKVVSENTGQPIGFGLSIVRQIAHIVDTIICYIGYLFPLWDCQAPDPGGQDHDDSLPAHLTAARPQPPVHSAGVGRRCRLRAAAAWAPRYARGYE